ncbi:DDE superfamily endonuclease [Ceratobasidium sp. AG-Ba]|nr:DDE superfamily endonuclease [Ceratobasidium sp. AG-Ba]
MKEWVDECVVPYANRKCQELGRLPTQKAILILDCWSVHKGEEFLTWMKASHPLIILVFVPAGCTLVAQPCDTQINRILKHLIKSACVEYLSQETQRQLQMGFLFLRSSLTRVSAVRDAWHDTKFGDWDLSYETLTSARSRTLVHERFTEDIPFSLAISSQIPTDPLFVEVDSPKFDDDSALDPNMLVDIRGQLPMDVEEQEGGYIYTGDVA